jgi:hypothetical protein
MPLCRLTGHKWFGFIRKFRTNRWDPTEAGTQHKYALNILLDFKPGESPLRPEAEALMKRHAAERQSTNVCHGEYGWPVAGLLSEPMKIVQAPKETMILY